MFTLVPQTIRPSIVCLFVSCQVPAQDRLNPADSEAQTDTESAQPHFPFEVKHSSNSFMAMLHCCSVLRTVSALSAEMSPISW